MSKQRITLSLSVVAAALVLIGLAVRSLQSSTIPAKVSDPQEAKGARSVYQVVSGYVQEDKIDPKYSLKVDRAQIPPKAVFQCNLYGEAAQGGSAYKNTNQCPIERDFPLDRSFHQATVPNCSGVGASTPLQPADVPAGYFIACDGGYYWAVLPPIDKIAKEVDTMGIPMKPIGIPN